MCKTAFVFACLASAGHGQQVPTPVQQIHNDDFARDWQLGKQLTLLILALDPAAAFTFSTPRRFMRVGGHTHPSRIPMNAQMFFGGQNSKAAPQGPSAEITWKGPKPNIFQGPPVTTSKAVAGQKLKDVAAAAQIPIKYSCGKGSCKSCEILVNGRMVSACVGKLPKGQVEIEYFRTKESMEVYDPKKKDPNALTLQEQLELENAQKAAGKKFKFR